MVPTWPAIGRQRELALLATALREGIPSVILAGEAGTGRTRLVLEGLVLADSHGRPTAFVAGSAAAAVPLGALAHLLPEEIAPADVGVQLTPANLLRYAAAALVDVLGDHSVLGVDHVHLLDPLSMALLHHLVADDAAHIFLSIRTGPPSAHGQPVAVARADARRARRRHADERGCRADKDP